MSPNPLPLSYNILMSGEVAVCLLRMNRTISKSAARFLYDAYINDLPIPEAYGSILELVFLFQTEAWTPSVH